MTAAPKVGRFGLVGTVVGLLALIVAVMPLWVLPAVFPPKPIEQEIVDTARELKNRVIAKVEGTHYQAPQEREAAIGWYRACSIAAVSLGLVAIGLAAFSVLRHESWRYAGTAAALGTGAIAFQLAMAALAVVIAFAIVIAAFKYLGISL